MMAPLIAIDDQELVGLDGFAPLVAEVGEHQAGVVALAEKLVRHGAP